MIVGVELEAARRRCAHAGIDDELTEVLLGACERGAVSAWNEKEEPGGED
ncbi:hypothetical protein [Devosia sp. Leaf420]|nr:hypothetical protein [Devosia sp. Leaf420]